MPNPTSGENHRRSFYDVGAICMGVALIAPMVVLLIGLAVRGIADLHAQHETRRIKREVACEHAGGVVVLGDCVSANKPKNEAAEKGKP